MNVPTSEDVTNESLEILKVISANKKVIDYKCKDGGVCINPLTFDFTYYGDFGSAVSRTISAAKISFDDTAKKIGALACCKLIYSMNNGGFNLITLQ